MAISRLYTFVDSIVPTAAQINGELNNIINNALSLISPLTGALDLDGYALTYDAAGVTTIQSPATTGFTITPGAKSGTPSTTGGVANIVASTYTDSNTAGSGTATAWVGTSIQRPTLAATNSSVTTTDAATFAIINAPAAGTNETLTRAWALWVDDGASRFDGVIDGFAGGFPTWSFTATVASSALTITLTDIFGNAPSAQTPVPIAFRNATLTTNTWSIVRAVAATTLVVPSGAELGAVANTLTRLWVGVQNDAGTLRLCIFNTQASNQLYALPSESAVHSATAIGTGSDSAGVLYASGATTSMPVRWLGYIEITEATPGTWATAPAVVQVLAPGVTRSGQTIQMVQTTYATETNNDTSTYADTGLTLNITPTNACNRVLVSGFQGGVLEATNVSQGLQIQVVRGSTSLVVAYGFSDGSNAFLFPFEWLDAPAASTATTYKTQFKHASNNARVTVQQASATSRIFLREVFA